MRRPETRPKRVRALENAARRRATRARRETVWFHPDAFLESEVKAPTRLSLFANPGRTVAFLREVLAGEDKYVDLGDVEVITPETAAVLAAAVAHRPRRIAGNHPKNDRARDALVSSGFYQHVRATVPPGHGSSHGLIYRIGSSGQVDPEIVAKCVAVGAEHSTGHRTHLASYRCLLECYTNTFNHAGNSEQGAARWWCSVFCLPNHASAFTFVDFGEGILRTIAARNLPSILQHLVMLGSKARLLRDVMAGHIGTRTDHPGRGKGLPAMRAAHERGKIFNLKVVANDAIWHADGDHAQQLDVEFPGTMIYWEMRP